MKRELGKPAAAALSGGWPDAGFKAKCPVLTAFLEDDKWDDGKPRELSSLSLKLQDGLVLGVLNDQDGRRSLYRAAQTVAEVLQKLDESASDPESDWRAWNNKTRKK